MASLAKRMTLRGDKLSAIRSRLHSKEYHRDLALPAALKGIAHVVVNDQWNTVYGGETASGSGLRRNLPMWGN